MIESAITLSLVIGFIYALRKMAKMIKEEGDTEAILSDPWEWLAYGNKKDWIRFYCLTHDSYLTKEERQRYEEYQDPCVSIWRMVVDDER